MTTTSRRGRHPYRGNRPSVYSGGVPNGLIRRAQPNDVPEILAMVRDLAEYEKAVHEAIATEAQFHEALFGPQPTVFAHVVEHESGELHLGGFALWFLNFSTWLGRNGIYLEDLYVRPELRGTGYGKRLLATLARECLDNGFGRLDWWVLADRMDPLPRDRPRPRRPGGPHRCGRRFGRPGPGLTVDSQDGHSTHPRGSGNRA
jgi:GNAT superfamily N-acetyltransferase